MPDWSWANLLMLCQKLQDKNHLTSYVHGWRFGDTMLNFVDFWRW